MSYEFSKGKMGKEEEIIAVETYAKVVYPSGKTEELNVGENGVMRLVYNHEKNVLVVHKEGGKFDLYAGCGVSIRYLPVENKL